MALESNIETAFGIPAKYWRVTEIHELFLYGAVHVTLHGYVSKEARNEGKACISEMRITLEGADYKPEMARSEIYVYLKSLPQFEGAIDV